MKVTIVKDGKIINDELEIIKAIDEFLNELDESTEDKDKEDDVTVTGLEAGTYSVYSFANISDAELGTITEGSPSPDFDSKSFAVNGNDMDIKAKGIPMSNKQEVTINSDGQPNVKKLYVVRMLSKITLKFRNMTGGDITVNKVSISDITSNPATGTENIKLLPKTFVSSANVAQMPNLAENAKSDEFTHAITSGLTVAKNTTDYDTDNSRSVSFYVNESQAGKAYPYFVVTLETNVGSQRYFMYTEWYQIARNDHHVLKLALSDYKLRLKVEDFSAIGMYPSLKDDGKQLNLTFHYPGEEFHIVPSVTYYYDRHEDGKRVVEKFHAFDFIKKLIIHIPEKGFNMVRYYGIYAGN